MIRRALACAVIALSVAALPQAALGLLVWTFVVLPLTVTAGQGTVFTMTATNVAGPDDLGCMEVTLPSSFSIESVSDPVASNGDDWSATLTNTTVLARSLSGGGRLNIGESVTFQVKATPSAAGVTSWPNHAHRQQDCGGLTEIGLPVQVVVLPAVLPSPTPKPSPTPNPTPRPTVRPTPLPSLPVSLPPLPSLGPSSTPAPTARPTDSASPSARTSPSSTASEAATPSPVPASAAPTSTPGGDGAGTGTSPSHAPRVPPDPGTVRIGSGTLTVLDGFGTWSVPAAVVGVPGLLVVLWVALQTVGALAWIPAVRRLRGEDGARPAPESR